MHDTGKEPVWDQTSFRSVFLSSNSEVASAFFQGSGVLIQCALCLGIVRILDLQEQISYEVSSGARQRALVTIQPTLPTLPTTRCIDGRFRRFHSGQKQCHIQLPRLGSHLCRQVDLAQPEVHATTPRLRQELNDRKLHKKDQNASKGAQVCPPPPPLKYLPPQFFTDLVSYLVEDVLHVLSALERPNAVDEAAVLKL